jgi:hypothetical protein
MESSVIAGRSVARRIQYRGDGDVDAGRHRRHFLDFQILLRADVADLGVEVHIDAGCARRARYEGRRQFRAAVRQHVDVSNRREGAVARGAFHQGGRHRGVCGRGSAVADDELDALIAGAVDDGAGFAGARRADGRRRQAFGNGNVVVKVALHRAVLSLE